MEHLMLAQESSLVYNQSLPETNTMSHIAVERNRRRQMNEHLKVLRSLTPCFYIKRGDQASIIGGVIEFVKELHQVLQALESKKQRKSSSLSPGPAGPCLSPSPSAPLQLIATRHPDHHNPFPIGNTENDLFREMWKQRYQDQTCLESNMRRIPGQIVRIISVLENLSFEILHLSISSMEDTVLYSFVIKVQLTSSFYAR
uniref:BHLH domain-containing protein n=1 Tax=Salix viminalis TaxID=40686 RepID=A0A6N2LQ04_SALVM